MGAPAPVGIVPWVDHIAHAEEESGPDYTAAATGMVPMPNFEFWDASARRLLAVGGATAQDRAASSCAFGLFDIPTSPRARASARSWTTLHVLSGTAVVGSATGRREAAASMGTLSWAGSRAADARSSFCCSFSTRAPAREADRLCAFASVFQRSARSLAFVSFFSVLVSWPRRVDRLFSSSFCFALDFSIARFCFLLLMCPRSSVVD